MIYIKTKHTAFLNMCHTTFDIRYEQFHPLVLLETRFHPNDSLTPSTDVFIKIVN